MRVLLSWMREFAPIDGEPVAIAETLSDLGLGVESMQRLGEGLDGIVLARVVGLRPHPSADRIQLVDVDAGGGEVLQVCCGAFNMSLGDLVPLAPVGASLPDGSTIERRRLRGEWSNGMLCSSRELGLGDDHAGIMLVEAGEPGAELREALGLSPDVLFDLEVNPNRPDALSVAGVARDLAARLGVPFGLPEPRPSEDTSLGDAADLASVDLLAPDLCGRFLVRVFGSVEVGPSPAWLAARLRALGMRPVNNVVDASNYVMLELGQPNHTYDLVKVAGAALRVRWARDGEEITTLDGVRRSLDGDIGVIADGDDAAIGLAGVMGGESTEITDASSRVLLELAWWEPMAVARASRRLGLRSEASVRFERGTDPEIVELAARRFAELLAPSGARPAPGVVDSRGDGPRPMVIRLRTSRVGALLGTDPERDLPTERIAALLEPIGFVCNRTEEPGVLSVSVPTFRPDVSEEVDLVEEVARHHGYGRIPRRMPAGARVGSLSARQRSRRLVREVLVGMGVDEAMPLPFLAPEDSVAVGAPQAAVKITNPLAAEESVLRTSLRPGLLRAVAYNVARRVSVVSLFEVGNVFLPPTEATAPLPDERENLGVVLAGSEAPAAVELWRVLAEALRVGAFELDQRPLPGLHPGRSAGIVVAGSQVGLLGEVDPAVLEALGIECRVALLEVDIEVLSRGAERTSGYVPVSRFPSSDFDLAFEVDDSVPAATLERLVRESGGELVRSVELFDVFRGDPVAAGSRSLAFSVRLQASDRTLTDREVAEVRDAVVQAVQASVPARLRA